jgi:apolipoprotein N-acyltransferase
MTRTAIAAAALSALLLWAASPAVGAGPLTWIALVPVAVVTLRWPLERAGRLAVPLAYAIYLELLLIPALPFGLTDGQWGDPPPVLVGGSPVLIVALGAVPLFGVVLYLLRFGQPWGADTLPSPLAPLLAVLVPVLSWTALDLLRAKFDPGGLWGPLYLSQADEAPGGLAAVGGPWLVTFSIVAFNYALALALLRRSLRIAAACASALVLVVVAAGAGESDGGGSVISVAAIQPGYDTAEEDRPQLVHWEPESFPRAALDVIADLARVRRHTGMTTDLVVWPEGSVFVDPLQDPPVLRAARAEARRADATLAFPYFDYDSSNSAALAVGSGGQLAGPQPKQRPMWFLDEHAEDAEALPLHAAGLSVGTMLGVDTQDPGVAAALADGGADVIAAATHDWEELAAHHRAATAIAARASGVPIVRADWRYGSAIYDAEGDLVAEAPDGLHRTVVTATLALGEPTPYARIGDVMGWAALILAAGAALGAWITPRLR